MKYRSDEKVEYAGCALQPPGFGQLRDGAEAFGHDGAIGGNEILDLISGPRVPSVKAKVDEDNQRYANPKE